MTSPLLPIPLDSFNANPFTLIGDEWMLITAGTLDHCNTMTASWGGLGVLWNRPVCLCYVRPTRYTYQFLEAAPGFTLSFFDRQQRPALELCGSKSGRDLDKIAAAGLTPLETSPGLISFAEARLVFECRKLYTQDIDPACFLDPAIQAEYPQRDYHRLYLGEVLRLLAR